MSDHIIRNAASHLDRIAANAIAAATKAHGKPIPYHVQSRVIESIHAMRDEVEEGLRADEAAWEQERAMRLTPGGAGLEWNDGDVKVGGTD